MDFAKNLLKKYGWKEGDGLGKNSNGIIKPLQANLKFDTAGLGVDKAAEFNNHWWERVFNDAANNIKINADEKNVKIAINDQNAVELTTKEYSVTKLKNGKTKEGYKNFIKKSILTGLREKIEECEKNDPKDYMQLNSYKVLTDEELFAACGGRTAHKGARHGLKLTGKLSRIEEHERILLDKMQDKNNEIEENEWKVVPLKKKRKRDNNKEENSDLQDILYTNDYHIKSKKKKKREKNLDTMLSNALETFSVEESPVDKNVDALVDKVSNKKKKGKRKELNEHSEDYNILDNKGTEFEKVIIKKEKKVKDRFKAKDESSITVPSNFLKSNERNIGGINKKKKKKLQKYIKNMAVDLEASLSLTSKA